MMLILGVIAVLLFGERLPEVARSVGKGFMEFKKGVRSIQDDVEGAINSAASTSTDTASPLRRAGGAGRGDRPEVRAPPSP